MRRGSSGAQIHSAVYMGSPVISKMGDERVGEQGRWLLTHPSPALPAIATVSKCGYFMEVLEDCKIGSVPPWLMVKILRENIWPMFSDKMTLTPLDPSALRLKVYNLLEGYVDIDEYRPVYKAASIATGLITAAHENETFTPALTHGDPTWDNIMMRRKPTGAMQFVFIDPLPARLYAPDWEEVDLGKIVQSLAGFEADRYNMPKQFPVYEGSSIRGTLWDNCRTTVQAEVALAWGLIHCLRVLPYVSDEIRATLLRNTISNVTRAIL